MTFAVEAPQNIVSQKAGVCLPKGGLLFFCPMRDYLRDFCDKERGAYVAIVERHIPQADDCAPVVFDAICVVERAENGWLAETDAGDLLPLQNGDVRAIAWAWSCRHTEMSRLDAAA